MKRAHHLPIALAIVLTLTLLPTPVWACTATCTGGSCSGTNSCGCVGGDPVCTDCLQALSTVEDMEAFSKHLDLYDEPGIPELKAVVEEMQAAVRDGDLDLFLAAKSLFSETLSTMPLEVQTSLRQGDCGPNTVDFGTKF